MRKTMFFKMAAENLKKNRQTCLPFILTLAGTAAIYDVMGALTESRMVASMFGGSFMVEILRMGRWVVGIFSLIFLFYTNSFLLKRRKKEFGLYHILGLEKRHVALLLILELFYTVLAGLALGILTGTLLYKAVFLLLCRILHEPMVLGFDFSVKAMENTGALFGGDLSASCCPWHPADFTFGSCRTFKKRSGRRAGTEKPLVSCSSGAVFSGKRVLFGSDHRVTSECHGIFFPGGAVGCGGNLLSFHSRKYFCAEGAEKESELLL